MERRGVLASAVTILAGLSGCAMDLNNESQIKITNTDVSCGEIDIDVYFESQNHSEAVERKPDEIVASNTYVETPPYDSATTDIFETLVNNFDSTSGTMKHDGSCYRVEIQRLYDS